MKDTLQVVQDSISTISQLESNSISHQNSEPFNWWLIIAIIELFIIISLFVKHKRAKGGGISNDFELNELSKAKSEDIDMTNLMNSISSSRDLYKELSRKCHPDRFQDETIKTKADKLFQEISRNKRNHAQLIELKEMAKRELNIKF